MKNDIKINILNHGKVEIIDDEEFIQKLRNSKNGNPNEKTLKKGNVFGAKNGNE